jgi:uncharacterized protein (TIGR02217 family)
MAFREIQFPPDISFGGIGGPGFKTDVVSVLSGHEKRNARWSEMRHSYEVSHAVKTEAHFKAIRAFFMSVGGKRDGFRFKDWADYRTSLTEGVVDGITTTTFQLQKQYVSGDVTTLRDITKPIASGFVLQDSGVTLTLSTDYSFSTVTGVLTTVVPRTASNLKWSGQFDVPCRFDVDELHAQVVNRNPTTGLLLAWESIPIIEIRV